MIKEVKIMRWRLAAEKLDHRLKCLFGDPLVHENMRQCPSLIRPPSGFCQEIVAALEGGGISGKSVWLCGCFREGSLSLR